MKILNTLSVVFTLALLLLASCKKDDEVIPPPAISSFSPSDGPAGTAVIITGDNFSSVLAGNDVAFNGTTATVTASTKTQITVTVPQGATTGKILITVKNQSTSSSSDFVVLHPPTISSFNPASGLVGATVTITGTNFSAIAAENIVAFNGIQATVTTSTSTQLTTTVPQGAAIGKITVTIGDLSGTSSSNFLVLRPPAISSFDPASGPAGATVTITGTNFSPTAAENTVTFNGTQATVTASTATQLITTVPPGATTGKIAATIGNLSGSSASNFIVLPQPTISSFNPASGLVGATVTIAGTNFSPIAAENSVTFNGTQAIVTASSSTQITTSVPLTATTGKVQISVNGVAVTSTTNFTVLFPPAITSFTPSTGMPATSTGFIGVTVTITGSHFSSLPSENIVKFNGTASVVSASTSTQLITTVPLGATTGKIGITVNGITVESMPDFQVSEINKWSQVADFAGGVRQLPAGFVIGTKIYLGLGQDGGGGFVKDFWEYNTETNEWTKKKDFPAAARPGPFSFAIGTKGYIGGGSSGSASNLVQFNDFWEYNPATDDWVQKADFEGPGTSSSVSFSIGSKGYVGSGRFGSSETDELWEYNPATNDWVQKEDLPAAFAQGFSFVINGKGYVGHGSGPGFWEYTPSSNSWVPKKDFAPLSISGNNSSFSIGTKGYAVNTGDTFINMYDPVTNEWTQKANLPASMGFGQGFSTGNNGYLMTGIERPSNALSKVVFKYIPD